MLLHRERADHSGPELDASVEEFAVAVETGLLDYAAHYSFRHWDFEVDHLQNGERQALRKVGGQVSSEFADLDDWLLSADTGRLVRAVLHGPDGVLFCNAVVPLRHAVAFRLGAAATHQDGAPLPRNPDLRAADRLAAQLADTLRTRISLTSLNPGGWYSENPGEADTVDLSGGGVFEPREEGTAPASLRELCRSTLGATGTHYLAYCCDGTVEFSVDCLGHPRLADHFVQTSIADHRLFYRKATENAAALAGELGRTVASVLGPRLERLVLDVEQGALYYYRIATGRWLLGVTLRQSRVSQVDDALASLALAWH